MIANIVGPDLGVVLAIIVLVLIFGSQLPKLARNAGMAGREFRNAQREAEEDAEPDPASGTATASVGPPPAASPPQLLPAPLKNHQPH